MQQSQAEITQQSKQQYRVSGTVDFSTVPDLMRKMTEFFETSDADINIDLSEVTSSNSAALALLLEMVRQARSKNIELHFRHLPDTMLSIAKAYGIDSDIREFT
ncbi:MAG TPA: STAS domain-containing protein [Gammaproteobacteria bacterium]|nr:STAS domain-containing protein [Gammaproteobacteria bacterium]